MKQADKTFETPYWAASPIVAFLCITVLGALIYGNTLHVPWYFDDIANIVRNPAIRDLDGAWRGIFAPRGLAMLSFALNYHFHGLELPGYHIVNILIHLLTTFFVYLSLSRVFRGQPVLALLAALIFLSHPLQTQSVTYLVQRMTSMCGLFFFMSLYFHVRGREALLEGSRFLSLRHLLFYLASLVSGAAAVYTKQNAAILPLCLFLYGYYFLPKQKHSHFIMVLYLLPYCAAPLLLAWTQLVSPVVVAGKSIGVISSMKQPPMGMNVAVDRSSDYAYSLTYLVTEFSVVWIYIRLLFLPYAQILDYQYPLTTVLFTFKNILAFFGLVGLSATALLFRKRVPLVSFGILWFLTALSVESTIIPLDTVFEHRLYIPLFGFAVLVTQLLDSFCRYKAKLGILLLTVLIYSVLTWFRNDLWSRETSFYEDQLAKVPHNIRAMVSLSNNYLNSGRDRDAEALSEKMIQIDPYAEEAYINLSNIMIKNRRVDEALRVLKQGLQHNPNSSKLLNNLGVFYDLQGQPDQAIPVLYKAISIAPDYAETYTNLGAVYAGLKRWKEAERYYRTGISAYYENPKAHYNLGVALYSQGRMAEAAEAFRLSLKFAPEDTDALFNLANVYIELGNTGGALELLPRVRSRDQEMARMLDERLAAVKEPALH